MENLFEMEAGKVIKREVRTFFFFFFFAFHFWKWWKFVLDWIYQNGNFLTGTEKYACYAPDHIHSNKSQGRLDKSFWVSAYLFSYLLKGWTQKWMILTIFRVIPSHIELSMQAVWIDVGRWLIILWFLTSK